jgi:hypothetical protein
MKVLNSKLHGMIDYVVVAFLWLSPTLFGLSHTVSLLTYALGGVHLTLTMLTNFHYGVFKIIPLKVHGLIELIVGIALIASPLAMANIGERFIDHYFFMFCGLAVLATWAITDYSK